MALHIDHIALGARNIYESAARLRKETGLGFWTGEWVGGTAVHVVPLGGNQFIEVEGLIDAHRYLKMPKPVWYYDVCAVDNEHLGDHFMGLCLGVDSREELQAQAKRLGSKINEDNPDPTRHFQRADGYVVHYSSTPSGNPSAWMRGLPNFYYYPDKPGRSANQPVVAAPHLVEPTGIKWIEMGGTEAAMSKWLGQPASTLSMRFNGKSLGIWAVCVGTEDGKELIIRRPPASEAVPAAA